MCLAPRYISGTIARPSSPCRKTASLPDTPCALSAAEAIATSPIVSNARFMTLLGCWVTCVAWVICVDSYPANSGNSGYLDNQAHLVALIAFMTCIAGDIDLFSNGEDPGSVFGVRKL